MKKIGMIFAVGLVFGIGLPSYTLATEEVTQSSDIVEVIKNDTEMSSEDVNDMEVTTESEVFENTNSEESKENKSEELIPKIEEEIDQLVGEKKGEPVQVDAKPSPSQIRENLLSDDFGISKEELDKYTDEQLEQTMTLFTRYNYDIIGMDYGSYSRLLKTLFDDKTVNVNDALTQLSFDPSSFSSFSSIIPEVERLKVYLDTLYPVNSSFLPGLGLNTEQLIERLNTLQKLEDQLASEGKDLPFGRIAALVSSDINPTEDSDNSTDNSSSGTKDSVSESKIIESTDKKNEDKKKDSLPKTGESSNLFVSLIGLGLVSLVVIPLRKKF